MRVGHRVPVPMALVATCASNSTVDDGMEVKTNDRRERCQNRRRKSIATHMEWDDCKLKLIKCRKRCKIFTCTKNAMTIRTYLRLLWLALSSGFVFRMHVVCTNCGQMSGSANFFNMQFVCLIPLVDLILFDFSFSPDALCGLARWHLFMHSG